MPQQEVVRVFKKKIGDSTTISLRIDCVCVHINGKNLQSNLQVCYEIPCWNPKLADALNIYLDKVVVSLLNKCAFDVFHSKNGANTPL